MSELGPIIKTTLTLPEDLYWKVKGASTKRRTTFKRAVIQALEAWLAQKGQSGVAISEGREVPKISPELPPKYSEKVRGRTVPEELQSNQLPAAASDLAAAVTKLHSSGRTAELHALTAFAAFLVSHYEPSEATPEQASADSTDPLDRAREVIELAQRSHEATGRALEEQGVDAPPRADAPRPAKRNRKDATDNAVNE